MERQVQLAKSILENAGYVVTKKIDEAEESQEYTIEFIAVDEVSDQDLSSRVADVINKAGATNKGVRKIAGKYQASFICSLTIAKGVEIMIENIGFFQRWIKRIDKSFQESAGQKLKFEDLAQYSYQFRKSWKSAPNSTYSDDLLELAEKYNCLQIKYNDGYNNTKFICKDESDYQKLKDALSQNKILKDFISLSEIREMDWDVLASKVDRVYVDRYSGGYTVRIPKQKVNQLKIIRLTKEGILKSYNKGRYLQ